MKKIFCDKMPTAQEVAFHIDNYEFNILHTHEYFEFALTSEGSVLHFINDARYVVHKNQIILLAPENMHRTRKTGKDVPFDMINLQIRVDTFEKICDVMGEGIYQKVVASMPYCLQLSEVTVMQIREYIERAQRYDYRDTKRHLIMKGIAFLIVLEIVRDKFWERQYADATEHRAIELFFASLNDKNNIGKSFAELCEEIPYHKSHIIRVFKQKGMEAPNKILTRHKMNYAANLLLTTDMKIIDIANAIGYGSVAYFNKVFRSTYDRTPSEYRKRTKKR